MEPSPLVEYRTAVARAARSVRRSPTVENRAALDAARRELATANIEAYVNRVVAGAPPLTESQLDRLAQLVRPSVARREPAA